MLTPARKIKTTPKTAAQAKADKYITPTGRKPKAKKEEELPYSLDGAIKTMLTTPKKGKAKEGVVAEPETGSVVPFPSFSDPIPDLVTKSRSAGRPTKYSEALADEIVHRMSEGASILDISRDEDMPARSTIMKWQAENEDFRTRIALARQAQADLMDDLTYEVARNSTPISAPADRVKLQAYAWRAQHLEPKRYGNQTQIQQTVNVNSANFDLLSRLLPEEREQLRGLLTTAAKRQMEIEGQDRTRTPRQIEGSARRG